MMGVERRNEKRAAEERSRLRSSPATMVIPLRETPGITASACAAPMVIASKVETWLISFCLRPTGSANHRQQSEQNRGGGDDVGAAQGVFGLFFEQKSGDGAGDGPNHQQPQQAAILRKRRVAADVQSEALADNLDPVLKEKEDHRGQRADVQSDVEGETAVVPAEDPRNRRSGARCWNRAGIR